MSLDYQDRFGLGHHPFDKYFLHRHPVTTAGIERLMERFRWLLAERGIGVLTGVSGVGKTAALAQQVGELPSHRYRVVYLEDSGASANDIFRSLAYGLDLEPAFRRAALWRDLKGHILKLDEENDQQVVIVIDDAHRLPSGFLNSLGAFMNFAFDSRELMTVWLVGDSRLTGSLQLASHRHLLTRVRIRVHLDPLGRDDFRRWVRQCMSNAGCKRDVATETALDAAFHLSRGVPRTAAKILGVSLSVAHELDKDIVDEQVVELASKELLL